MKKYSGVMVYAEQKNSEIHKITYELLRKARELADKTNEQVYCCICYFSGLQINELIYRSADKVFYVKDDEIFNMPEIGME